MCEIRPGEWVAVCDGGKAIILENRGDEKFPNLRTREVHEQPDPPTHAQGTDAPGRVHQSQGSARSSVQQTDWHDEAERKFLEEVAKRLDRAAASRETHGFIIVASPRALGMLRAAYTPAVRAAVRVEIAKDWVKMPVHEIEKHLLAHVVEGRG